MTRTLAAARAPRYGIWSQLRSWTARGLMALALTAAAGAASAATYVDAALGDVKPEDRVVVAHPAPVQLLFQFQTKGAPNAQATKLVKQQVIDAVKASGLFSEVSEGPTPNGAVLSVAINDVADPKDMQDAEAKGAVTGATLFIAGSNIREHYICTIEYVSGPSAPKLTRTAQHVVIFQMGLINSAPKDAVKVGGIKDAVFVMARQIVSNPLNALAADPAFQGAPAAEQTASAAVPAPVTAAAPPATPTAAPAPTPVSTPVPTP